MFQKCRLVAFLYVYLYTLQELFLKNGTNILLPTEKENNKNLSQNGDTYELSMSSTW